MYNVLIADDHAIVRSGIAYLIDKQPTFQVVGQTANGTDTYMRGHRHLDHGPLHAAG